MVPQLMFRVELKPTDIKLKANEILPIYNTKYRLRRTITIE